MKSSERHFFHYTFHNTASEHVFIPEINPHCILSQMYALLIEFYYALFLFLFLIFKGMHNDTYDKISYYFDRFICQRLYYDAEIA
jgi:hypothetical protein